MLLFQIAYSDKALKFLKKQNKDVRVLFDINGNVIDIIKIGNRGQIYKGA